MDEAALEQFFSFNPKYREIVERAIAYEEEHEKEEYYLGWSWSDVRAYPGELMKLIREGIVRIRYQSRRYTHYLLVDRAMTKRALGLS